VRTGTLVLAQTEELILDHAVAAEKQPWHLSSRMGGWSNMIKGRRSAAAQFMALACAFLATPGQAEPNAPILAALEACGPDSRVLIEQLVAIDSGTGDVEGLEKVGAIYTAELRELGAEVRRVPSVAPATGDNIVATFTGSGRGRILLIAHMDTVFARGDVAERMPHWEGDHYVGPGAGDDKSGGVTALCALGALKATGFRDFGRIDLLLNASEEGGSLGSRDLIRAMAREADVTINLERGVPRDQVVVSRKGSAVLRMEFTGRAAHSGLEPQNGRNAVLEAARVALELGKLADAEKQTTVTVTIMAGGDRINVVPERAQITADVRAFSAAEFDRVEQGAARLAAAPGIDGVTIASTLTRNFPAWPRAASTEALLARANRLYGELGRSLTGVTVGSSADVAFAAESGKPAIDGFGMEGGGAHGPDDYADFATLVPRAYVLARMLMDLGHAPPP
jgi:glutamate carboxypeptidase